MIDTGLLEIASCDHVRVHRYEVFGSAVFQSLLLLLPAVLLRVLIQ